MRDTETLHPSQLTDDDAQTWRALAAAHAAFGSPLLGPDFTFAVAKRREDARVTIFRRDHRAVGFLPHHRRPGGLARPIGGLLSDFHALVSTPDAGLVGPEALAAAGASAWRYTGLIDPFGIFGPTATRDSHAIVLEQGDAEAYLETVRAASAKRFKNWRRLENKLDREIGPLRLVAPDTSQHTYDMLIAWKRDQLHRTGGHDFLRPEWTRGLLDDLFARREGDFRGLMVSLYAGDQLVAGHIGVRLGEAYHPWIASTDPAMSALSPGQAFLSQAIGAMPALGLRLYDLGPGHDHYKRPWALTQTPIGEGLVTAASAAGRVASSVESAWRLAGARRGGAVDRLQRRLNAIASTETTVAGRMRGLIDAMAARTRKTTAEG